MTAHQANQLSNTKKKHNITGSTKNVIAPQANQHDHMKYIIKSTKYNTILL